MSQEIINEVAEEKMVAVADQVTEALEESVKTGKAEEAIEKLENAIRASGNAEILDMVKQNQELFEISNSLLFRAVGLAANTDQDVFIINANNGVVFITETDYTQTLENAEVSIKEQIGSHHPDLDEKSLSEKYDEYVAHITLKHIDKEVAKKYISAIQDQQAAERTQIEAASNIEAE